MRFVVMAALCVAASVSVPVALTPSPDRLRAADDRAPAAPSGGVPGAPDWLEGGVCYEVFVRSFYDSDGDGVGDLAGLIRKLDYINDGDPATRTDLGARCIWLMPIHRSPSYHGYDVTDYYRVDPEYGTDEDAVRLVEEAHRRGIRVLIDLVVNHVSSEHPFFRHALVHPDSPYRDWFLFSPAHPGWKNEWGTEVWHRSPIRDEYYYGFFWSGMPDLDWRTPAVREEFERVAGFWLREIGVDGFRLDAVRHLMEEGERTTNVPATHEALRDFAARVRRVAPEAFTIGEVYDGTDALLPYYPDQLDAYFAFELSDAILDAVRSGSPARLLASVRRLQDAVPAGRWAPFLRNHDQTRTLTWLEGDVERAKLAAVLLLTLPGVPFVYYGEEIGMTGDKPDPRLRTPMHWSLGPAAGFTDGVPWEPLQPDSLTANVEALDRDPESILGLYRELIHLRASSRALGSGVLVPLEAGDDAVAAYLRRAGSDVALVVANLGAEPLRGVALSSAAGALPPGRYAPEALWGGVPPSGGAEAAAGEAAAGAEGSPLEVGPDGRLSGTVPVAALRPRRAHIWRLAGGPRGSTRSRGTGPSSATARSTGRGPADPGRSRAGPRSPEGGRPGWYDRSSETGRGRE